MGKANHRLSGKKALMSIETGAQTSLVKYDALSASESESSDSEDDATGSSSSSFASALASAGVSKKTKQKVMVCMSRGVAHRPRHLMLNLIAMLPHSRKESKLDDKKSLSTLNELADMNNCTKVMYLESRRGTDLYLWLADSPNGPSAKFQVLNEHTQEELKFPGNHLKGSRTILSFDASFESEPHLRLMRELLTQTFNVPHRTRRSKPFFDHVMQFSLLDGKIWVRNYQVLCGDDDETNESKASLAEVGPRFVLDPIRIFRGSFAGETLWSNSNYVTPGETRRLENAAKRNKAVAKASKELDRTVRHSKLTRTVDPVAGVFH